MLSVVLKNHPSRQRWLVVESLFELLGLSLLELHVSPWLACALIGIGAGGLFSLNLLLPIDATDHTHESAAWSAKAQLIGYVVGALGPIMLGWICDTTNSFASAVIAMIRVWCIFGRWTLVPHRKLHFIWKIEFLRIPLMMAFNLQALMPVQFLAMSPYIVSLTQQGVL